MKKSIAILVVSLVSLSAFAGNGKPVAKVSKTDRPPVKVERKMPENMKFKRPVEKPKKVAVIKPVRRK